MNTNELNTIRATYYRNRPGVVVIRDKKSSAVAAIYEMAGKVYACMFHGKGRKPAAHYCYRNADRRAEAVAEFFANVHHWEAAVVTRRAARKSAPLGVEVGDVLLSSWGYEQTNIDYYEVTAIIGSRMVEIRPIGQETVETGYMQGKCVPVPGLYIGEPMRKAAKDGAVKIASYASAYKVEPTIIAGAKVYASSHWTAYA